MTHNYYLCRIAGNKQYIICLYFAVITACGIVCVSPLEYVRFVVPYAMSCIRPL